MLSSSFFFFLFFRFFSSSKPPPDILTLFISLSGEIYRRQKRRKNFSCRLFCGTNKKVKRKKKIRKTTEKLAQKIAKLLLYGYQSVCFCVRSTWKMSLSLSRARLRFYLFYILDKASVLFVRWFWAPFFEQVVHALGLLFVTSESDVYTHAVKRHFRLFD